MPVLTLSGGLPPLSSVPVLTLLGVYPLWTIRSSSYLDGRANVECTRTTSVVPKLPIKEYKEILEGKATCRLHLKSQMNTIKAHVGQQASGIWSDSPRSGFYFVFLLQRHAALSSKTFQYSLLHII